MTTAAVVLLALLTQNDPEQVTFKVVAQGQRFPAENAVQTVLTTSKELEDYGKKLYPPPAANPLSKIDIDQEAVAIISLGTRPHSGYSVSVTKIVRTADAIRIEFRENLPDPEKKYAPALTYPFVIVRMAKPDRKVVFAKDAK